MQPVASAGTPFGHNASALQTVPMDMQLGNTPAAAMGPQAPNHPITGADVPQYVG
jgi:hypothetical protein